MIKLRLLKNINPESIVVPEIRVTARFDDEAARQFKESVKNAGIDEPLRCYQVEDQLVLSDGLHRLMEALANKQKVNVYVLEGSMADAMIDNLKSGHLRGKHPVSEMVKVIEALWKEFNLDSEAIAKKTGMTRDYVENLQKISELTPLCREGLDEGKIKVGHALSLTRLKDPVKQETVFFQITTYNMTVKDADNLVTEVLSIGQAPPETPAPAAPQVPTKVRCLYCGAEVDLADIANPNTCKDCSYVLATSIAEARRLAKDQADAAAAANTAQK
jgi:ParB-like chromosome segregation protein Spo0J